MIRYQFIIFLIAASLTFSCNSENKESKAGETSSSNDLPTGEANEESENSNSANKGQYAKIRLVLSGGDMPGTYEAICKESCCSYGLAEENAFGMQYSDTDIKGRELSSVQMIVENVTGNKNTKAFIVTVTLGELFTKESKSYTIDTRDGVTTTKGSGTLNLQYSNDKASIKINGQTAEGVKIDLSVECHSIFKL